MNAEVMELTGQTALAYLSEDFVLFEHNDQGTGSEPASAVRNKWRTHLDCYRLLYPKGATEPQIQGLRIPKVLASNFGSGGAIRDQVLKKQIASQLRKSGPIDIYGDPDEEAVSVYLRPNTYITERAQGVTLQNEAGNQPTGTDREFFAIPVEQRLLAMYKYLEFLELLHSKEAKWSSFNDHQLDSVFIEPKTGELTLVDLNAVRQYGYDSSMMISRTDQAKKEALYSQEMLPVNNFLPLLKAFITRGLPDCDIERELTQLEDQGLIDPHTIKNILTKEGLSTYQTISELRAAVGQAIGAEVPEEDKGDKSYSNDELEIEPEHKGSFSRFFRRR
jgi:hypothetical protein